MGTVGVLRGKTSIWILDMPNNNMGERGLSLVVAFIGALVLCFNFFSELYILHARLVLIERHHIRNNKYQIFFLLFYCLSLHNWN